MIRLLPWLLATGLLVPAAARGQQEVEVANGETIPNLRPCIDYVGRGVLRSVGDPEPIDDPDDLLGHGLYRYRFAEHAEILGHGKWSTTGLVQAGHALSAVRANDALVFLGRGNRFLGWQRVEKDKRGRAFMAIHGWPDPETRRDWMPFSIRRFARPVSYDSPQLWAEGESDGTDEPDIYVKRGGRWFVRYGLYLSDIPAMFEAAKAESCWR